MTLDLSQVKKADVYAAAQDLGERLARQIALNKVLHEDLNKLASRPCLECEIITPALRERVQDLERDLNTAMMMLNKIDADSVSLLYGTIVRFVADRRELNASLNLNAKSPTEGSNSPA